jgi:hypothetical protein
MKADNIPEFWENAKRHLDAVETDDEAYQTKAARGELNAKDTIQPLERTFGPIIDRLLLHRDAELRLLAVRAQVFADRVPRKTCAPGYLSDREMISIMPAPDDAQ